ncbi:nicotinate-nucleotide pyrophosphorylase (carboxylating) [Psychromicrobium silvestre]|uniref:Nicotinate-nucleotide pyrophosphorylase [carboxylating] n=1 Tax=Psychromicrobium silvestre TaxID=1645614 RepID=A0A7Y9LSC4_9MICC|nr:carboxylating nicotinate-nucleotide diphosphorylase [Psychromicrobium silvestre]NYE94706.1 nicotinate-nucleotide pyrophosphorylase (carboxylating) [Psychromicrobium silvestre]
MNEILPLSARQIETVVLAALDEDAPFGDLTSQLLIPEAAQANASLAAREEGVLSGSKVFDAAMHLTDPSIRVEWEYSDGERFPAGAQLALVSGPARSVLTAERVGLNLLQRMSGVASLTAQYVAAVAGSKARVADTRKTTPGLRALERFAVRCGGGHNHRYSLSDAVMAKDNHLAVLSGGDPKKLTEALSSLRSRVSHTTHIEVEVDRIEQIEAVLAAGVDTIMLDNFGLQELREGVALIAGRALVEASGNVRLGTIAEIAGTGVDIISVGALTHSVRALDLGLDVQLSSELG